nr:PREDICTED: LOW QUALITY PROTEIN: phosphatidylinositol 4,5-bisphosphate 3-kinase catalytic subunit delta isoform [Bemisia tabaci]
MVHSVESSYKYDFWFRNTTDQSVELSCLMPNGIFIPLEVNRNITLHEIKEDLWDEATKYPLLGLLHDANSYIFCCINSLAETEELIDENKRLCDIRPFSSVLKIVERKGDKAEIVLNQQISLLIGKSLHEFDSLKNPEVNSFRSRMKQLADDEIRKRQHKSWFERLLYQFPPRLTAADATLSRHILSRLKDGNFVILIKFDNTEMMFTFNVPHTTTPELLISMILQKKAITLNSKGEHVSEFALKACGREEYLVGDYPLIRFLYIQEALSQDATPSLVIISVHKIPVHVENVYENPDELDNRKTRTSFSTTTLRKKTKYIYALSIHDKFRFKICAISRMNCDANKITEVGVHCGIFHGGKSLCEAQKTTEKEVAKDGSAEWEKDIQFDVAVSNIPRMARLCIVVYELSKTKGVKAKKLRDSKQDVLINPLYWVNTTIYDYADDTLSEDSLNPLGSAVSNPNIEHCPALTISFQKYDGDSIIMYPNVEKLVEFALENRGREAKDDNSTNEQPPRAVIDKIRSIQERDPLYEMHVQERKDIWGVRNEMMTIAPTLLPKLLGCVEWNNAEEVAEITRLIREWPLLPPENSLELLDYAYADQMVRSFAVRCLFKFGDDDLDLFLIQLIQATKHEAFLHNDLVEFLLTRALGNQRIGHFFFWHLRSEMQVPALSIKHGLILETYCRGAPEHMRILDKQAHMIEKFRVITEIIKSKRDKDKDKVRQFLVTYLQEPHCVEAFSDVYSPLDPSIKLKRLKIEKCKVMDSKMRPLWLVFDNSDVHGDDIHIIFKSGDDLRQDMLTLQMFRIMDKMWKEEGLDLRMTPYHCISLDQRLGLIQVVLNAETIANIQKEKGMFTATSAFRKGSLLAWLKDYNPTEAALNKATEEFMYSCAGYCVATYVLGIADRHSDNIMIRTNGQLFHIDFGHILGHFKEKFGFRRERVPFVLTHDFVYIINKGQKSKEEAKEFQIFQKLCEQAFLILRRKGSFFMSLFAMMISTGLPELSSEKDLQYLQDTLKMDLSEDEALTHFRSKFDEALSNSWKTSLNWASHNLAKNNKP